MNKLIHTNKHFKYVFKVLFASNAPLMIQADSPPQ